MARDMQLRPFTGKDKAGNEVAGTMIVDDQTSLAFYYWYRHERTAEIVSNRLARNSDWRTIEINFRSKPLILSERPPEEA